MANTRVVYGDLKVGFTIGASTDPNTTDAPLMITELYKDCYNTLYGNQDKYSATDANIDSKIYDQMNRVVKKAGQRIIRKITAYHKMGSNTDYPEWMLNEEERNQLVLSYPSYYYFASHEDDDVQQVGDDIY